VSSLWGSVITVLGTLAGALLVGGLQARTAHAARRETHAVTRHSEALAAVTALVAALVDHRRTMWVREDLRLSDADPDQVGQARAASHETRSAVTAPWVTVLILLPDLATLARRATIATYALRHATTPSALAALRETAITTTDRLINAAVRTIANITTTSSITGSSVGDRPGEPR
jgi:hypothetical protein